MGVPVQHGGHTPHQSRVQLFAPGLRVPIQRCDIHLRRQIDGGLDVYKRQLWPPSGGPDISKA